jgi:ATP-binding cassette, subfamily B, bacterial
MSRTATVRGLWFCRHAEQLALHLDFEPERVPQTLMSPSTFSAALPASFPASWRERAAAVLLPSEQVLAWFEPDLDAQLRYVNGLVVLTKDRLLASSGAQARWQVWALRTDLKTRFSDHAGVGTLSVDSAVAQLASWRYTLGEDRKAQLFADRLQAAVSAGAQAAPLVRHCPRCDAQIADEHGVCRACEDSPGEQQAPSTWVLFRLWRFARPYRLRLLTGFMLTLGSTAATLVPPYMTMPLMDEVLIPFQQGHPIDSSRVAVYLGGLLVAALVAWVLGWARTYMLARVSERIGADLRSATFEHLLGLSLQYFGGKRTGDLIARIGNETDRINVFLSLHLLDFLTDLLMIGMTAAILVSIDARLAVVTLVPLPLIAWLIHQVRDRLRTGFEKVDRIWGEVTNVLADTIPGIRVVKAFAQERREADRFRAANRHNLQVNDRVNRVWSLFAPTVTLLTEVGLTVVWAVGIWQVAHGHVTVGVLTAFLAYISRFYTRLDSMSRIVSLTQKAAAGAKRIFDILDHRSSVPEPQHPVRLARVQGRIELRDVGFRYGNRAVIRDLSLRIEPGEMIGLVGHSGSGKSTLVNLISRFYDVSEGSILVDGTDLRQMAIADFRRNIGMVLQEPFLFFGTIAENIAYGKPDATRAEIIAAARAAHAHEFILRLPHGYDSLVGERGQSLSGGERQRISIARALLIDPRILILDEATSALDSQTEKEIQTALDNLVKGRTTIAVAHRLSTLRKADRLVVLEQGQVVEIGSHATLMAARGKYWALYRAQARNAEEQYAEEQYAEVVEPAERGAFPALSEPVLLTTEGAPSIPLSLHAGTRQDPS